MLFYKICSIEKKNEVENRHSNNNFDSSMVWASSQTKRLNSLQSLPVRSALSLPSPLTAPRPTPVRSGPRRTSATPATCTGARRSTRGGPSTSSPRYRQRWSTPGSYTATGEGGPWGTRGDLPKDFNICLFVCLFVLTGSSQGSQHFT